MGGIALVAQVDELELRFADLRLDAPDLRDIICDLFLVDAADDNGGTDLLPGAEDLVCPGKDVEWVGFSSHNACFRVMPARAEQPGEMDRASGIAAGMLSVSAGTIPMSIDRVEKPLEKDAARKIFVCPRTDGHPGEGKKPCPRAEIKSNEEG